MINGNIHVQRLFHKVFFILFYFKTQQILPISLHLYVEIALYLGITPTLSDFNNFIKSRRSLFRREARVQTLGQTSKRKYEKYFFGDFLSADFLQNL